MVPAADLLPNPKNWRTHPENQTAALRGVLAEVGFADAVLARELADGSLMLIDGHLRAKVMPGENIPVLVLDVDEAEADKILATLDPLAAMAEKDASQLASLLSTLKEQNDTLAALVWPDYIMDPLLAADWAPAAVGEMPTKDQKADQKAEQGVLRLTAEQRETVDAAIAKCREFNEDDSLTDAQCVELICQDYLAT